MKEIKTVEDVREVSEQIIGKLIKGNLAYFNLAVVDSIGWSQCFFTPTSELRNEKKNMIFVQDYDKILMLLLSHPKIKDIQYDEEENSITAIFDNPLSDEYDELDSYLME